MLLLMSLKHMAVLSTGLTPTALAVANGVLVRWGTHLTLSCDRKLIISGRGKRTSLLLHLSGSALSPGRRVLGTCSFMVLGFRKRILTESGCHR